MEKWKPIIGFETLYAVSNKGRVRREQLGRNTFPGKILKTKPYSKYGHLHVGLHRNGRRFWRAVHRLVLEAFVGPKPDGMECRHRDGTPTNNTLTNLHWGTSKQNKYDSIRHDTCARGSSHGRAKLSEQDIPTIKSMFDAGMTNWAIAKRYRLDPKTISDIRSGKHWVHI